MRKLPAASLVLAAGIVLFIAAGAFFILLQTAAMGMPRLGDDAYVHMWRAREVDEIGIAALLSGKRDTAPRAIRDIAGYCAPDPNAAPDRRAVCARLGSNVVRPDPYAGASMALDGILRLGLPLKWSYALYEGAILLLVAASFAYFLRRVVGPAAAGVAMVYMAFLVLMGPPGLTHYVPSVLVSGLSLALWAYVLGSASWQRYAVAGVAVLVLSKVHPLALVYGAGIGVLALLAFRRSLSLKVLTTLGLVVAGVLAVFLWLVDPIRVLLSQALSGNLAAIFLENIAALPGRLGTVAAANWGIVAGLLAGALICRPALGPAAQAAGIALLVLMPVTLLHRMEFFVEPADLFARVFVGFALLCCGVLGAAVVERVWGMATWRKAAAVACVLLLPLPSLVAWRSALLTNLNGRLEVLDESVLARTLAGFDRSSTLAYGELSISPVVAFLLGAHDRGAIPMSGMGAEKLERALAERRPPVVLVPNFDALNSLSVAASGTFERRRYGFAASVVDVLAVSSAAPIHTLHLRVENAGDTSAFIGPISYSASTDGRQARRLPHATVAPGTDGWIAVEPSPAAGARMVVMELPASRLWVRGIAVNSPPRPGVHWPWDSEAIVQWQLRNDPDRLPWRLHFSLPVLFRYWRAPGYEALPLAGEHSVLSDESGIVFITTDYGAGR
jgi:hypothetical protein